MGVAINVRGMAPLLQVFDMPTSLTFYCDKLGFEIVTSDGKQKPDFDWVLLRLEGVELMLNTAYERANRPAKPDLERTRGHRDVTLYFGCPDVDGAYAYLRSMKVDAKEPKVAWYGMKQMYLKDPDDYEICFQWRAS